MTAMVSARALWWHEAGCMCSGTPQAEDGWVGTFHYGLVDGWGYLTDRVTFMPVARLGGLPVGYANGTIMLTPQAVDGLATWLNATVIDTRPTRVFASVVVDPLEQAGFLIRPLEGVREAHGVCDPDLKLIGLVMPMARAYVAEEPKPLARAVSI